MKEEVSHCMLSARYNLLQANILHAGTGGTETEREQVSPISRLHMPLLQEHSKVQMAARWQQD